MVHTPKNRRLAIVENAQIIFENPNVQTKKYQESLVDSCELVLKNRKTKK